MQDPYASYPNKPGEIHRDGFLVVPSDTADLETPGTLWNTGSGTIKVTTSAGRTLVPPAGIGCWPILVTRVWATGTTATNVVVLI